MTGLIATCLIIYFIVWLFSSEQTLFRNFLVALVFVVSFGCAIICGIALNAIFNPDPTYFKNFNVSLLMNYIEWTNGRSIGWIFLYFPIAFLQLLLCWVQALTTNFTFFFFIPNLLAAWIVYRYARIFTFALIPRPYNPDEPTGISIFDEEIALRKKLAGHVRVEPEFSIDTDIVDYE